MNKEDYSKAANLVHDVVTFLKNSCFIIIIKLLLLLPIINHSIVSVIIVLFCFYYLQHLVFTFQKELLSNLPKVGQEGKIFVSLRVN